MNNDAPLLMVGPGTGIVPFIAFCQEREQLQQTNKPIAEAHLFFGCRDKDTDFIYRDFLASMLDKKVVSQLNLAFSRPADGSKKQYVQHLLESQTETIERLLRKENGSLYICGSTKMGQLVQQLIRQTLGDDYFKQMQAEKRVIVELWSSS